MYSWYDMLPYLAQFTKKMQMAPEQRHFVINYLVITPLLTLIL
jgi:hypothetical protein